MGCRKSKIDNGNCMEWITVLRQLKPSLSKQNDICTKYKPENCYYIYWAENKMIFAQNKNLEIAITYEFKES